ncbi:hypothetical protein Dgeo_2961 (plasmid) [Deinococcus geothermalis DSM 11300]|uniref:Uncharacterized protein n=1 Tax=Deinococcus geothermalis (strain DSM 11300 / CIP 105573 / AG-3a) TaxID=319795 RepID=A8ZR95_DEIGD|nr:MULTISPECIES: hypothetical protein [Deinococcus]ABW35004.1 hypothetical protein Dgeo_2961 [Deinococcus geothermalis DSM 11300]TDE84994.1 hypothetical protein E0686_14225 [Deinococcus sp. S9]
MTPTLDNLQNIAPGIAAHEGQDHGPSAAPATPHPAAEDREPGHEEVPLPPTAPATNPIPATPRNKAAAGAPRADQPIPYRLLSELLHDIPPEELQLVLDHYEDAVLKGTVKAIPAPAGQVFSVELITALGKRATRKVEEEIVLPDAAFHTWLAAERKASRLAVLAVTGRVETSLDKLARGDDDFQKLLDIRRKRLQRTRSAKAPK